MNAQTKGKERSPSLSEELKRYAKTLIVIKKIPRCKLNIAISAMLDREKGVASIEKQIAFAKECFNSFKEAEIRKFVLITSEYRKKTKPDFPDLSKTNVTSKNFSSLTKDEKRRYKEAKKEVKERINCFNNKTSQYEEARAFINDAESIFCTRINEGAARVNAYLTYYCKCAKYKTVGTIPKVQGLEESLHICWEDEEDVF